ncbi:MAG: YitT family protein [Roseburia sp.]|nr:YitT family protein [Roseburia sp.]
MKNKVQILKFIKKYALIVFGCVIYSLGVALFLDANSLAAGVTGIAIIINSVTGERIGTGWLIIIINVPLFILGAVFFGKKFIISTLFSTVLSSALIELWNFALLPLMPAIENLLIPAVAGGILYGAGLGLIFRMGSTTGGTDIIVKLLRKKFRHLKTGIISMLIDFVIVGTAGIIFRDINNTFYTVISIIMFEIAFDFVLYGGNTAKLVYVVTTADKSPAMLEKILKELEISATLIDGKGAYTGNERTVILCAVKNIMFPKLKDVIKEVDPQAFTIVTSAQEIYGEGYLPTDKEDL